MNILIVDDELDLRESISDLLKLEYDCEIDLCANGSEAFEACTEKEYYIIILDYRMPNATGLDFYNKLMNTKNPNRNSQILFLSGFIEEVERLVQSKKNISFKNKPIHPNELIQFVGSFRSNKTSAV